MPGPNLIESVGGQPQKQTRFKSMFTSRFFNGLFTNRSLLRGPLGFLYTDFYHAGTTDVLCDGLNSELSTRLTMIRRPGNPKYSSATVNAAVDSFYSFHQANGNIQVIVDTVSDIETLTTSTKTLLWTKAAGAGEGYFQGVNNTLYFGDGIDLYKYIPGTANPFATPGTPAGASIWNWGGAAPTVAPTLIVTQTGSSGVAWQATSMYTTMGLLDDGTSIQFLTSVTQNGGSGNYGTTGDGGPAFSNITGGTVVDGGCTWACKGPLQLWVGGTVYAAQSPMYDPGSNGVYISSGGTSGNTRPNFKPIFNTATSDKNGMVWQYIGPPALWQPSTLYNAYWEFPMQMVVEPILPTLAILNAGNQPIYVQTNNDATVGHINNSGTSGSGYTPAWATVVGNTTQDNNLLWSCLGSRNWAPTTPVTGWYPGSSVFSAIIDNNGNFQVCEISGTTQGTTPYAGWQASHSFVANSIIAVQNINSPTQYTAFQNEGSTGTTGSGEPTWVFTLSATTADSGVTWTSLGPTSAGIPVWGQTYGTTTADGSATWVNAGTAKNSTWVTNTIWYLPAIGFAPPSPTQPYGGAAVIGSAFNQFVTQSGLSKSGGAPSWSTTIGNTTSDGTITWTTVSAFNAVGFTFTKGYGYVYWFKARTANDVYVTTAPPLQQAGTNSPNIIGPLGPPTGSGDGTATTASPVGYTIGAQTNGANITISGQGSTDPQFDTVVIGRSTDGFYQSGPYLELTELAMPPIVNGAAGTWSIVDFMPDLATATLPGLNPLVEAPIDHVNDPPPGQFGSLFFTPTSPNQPTVAAPGTAMIGVVYHQGRLWGFVGSNVFASGGPDTLPGNGFTAWPADQVFPFQSNVIRLVSTTSGLLVFTTTDLYLIAGGPAITTYFSQLLVPGLGLNSWNALTLMAGVPYIFASDRQLIGIQPGVGVIRIGHPIGDLLQQFNPADVYLAYHSFGDMDHALFIGNGSDTWYRCDTNLAPDSQSVGPVWSPRATIADGFEAIASIETSPGIHQLLIGPTGPGFVLARDSTFSIFSDFGTVDTGVGGFAYSSFFTVGSIVLASDGQMAEMGFIGMYFEKLGTQPTVSVLLDELSATNGASFEKISGTFISDPPKMYGPTGFPDTLWMNRYYFSQTTVANPNEVPAPAWCKHLQIKVDFGSADTIQNELLAFSIWGALWQEA